MAVLVDLVRRQYGAPLTGGSGSGDAGWSSTGYYWREWGIFILIVILFAVFISAGRIHGRRRLIRGQPLMGYHKWLFSAADRDPNRARQNFPMAPVNDPFAQYPYSSNGQPGGYHGGVYRPAGRTDGSGIAAVPPAYDPYAQALPAYEPPSKGATTVSETADATRPNAPNATTATVAAAPVR
ncbi:hypothetical protein PYCC9005_002920 [Savitreella phatthalungensis]